jgi:hypothetical protein
VEGQENRATNAYNMVAACTDQLILHHIANPKGSQSVTDIQSEWFFNTTATFFTEISLQLSSCVAFGAIGCFGISYPVPLLCPRVWVLGLPARLLWSRPGILHRNNTDSHRIRHHHMAVTGSIRFTHAYTCPST